MINTTSALFSISETTTVYALRGGDGNAGTVNMSGTKLCSVGGGASGVDSVLVVGDDVWRADGGAGKVCAVAMYTLHNTTTSGMNYGGGGGGKKDMSLSILNRWDFFNNRGYEYYAIGGGVRGAMQTNLQGGLSQVFATGLYQIEAIINNDCQG